MYNSKLGQRTENLKQNQREKSKQQIYVSLLMYHVFGKEDYFPVHK